MTTALARRPKVKDGPKILILCCEVCNKRLGRAGYLAVDRASVAKRRENESQIFWKMVHDDCDENRKITDFRLPA